MFYEKAGARYAMEQVADIIPVVEKISQQLQKGEHPLAERGKCRSG